MRISENATSWDEEEYEDDSLDEFMGTLILLPLQAVVIVSASAMQNCVETIKDREDPGRKIDDAFVRSVYRLNDSRNPGRRERAVVDLMQTPNPAAARFELRNALKYDPSEKVRIVSAVALGKLGDVESLEYVRKAMKYDSSAEVRRICSIIDAKAISKPIHSDNEPEETNSNPSALRP